MWEFAINIHIFIGQEFLRGQFIGGEKRDLKEAEGKTDFKMETKHFSVLVKLINKAKYQEKWGIFLTLCMSDSGIGISVRTHFRQTKH